MDVTNQARRKQREARKQAKSEPAGKQAHQIEKPATGPAASSLKKKAPKKK